MWKRYFVILQLRRFYPRLHAYIFLVLIFRSLFFLDQREIEETRSNKFLIWIPLRKKLIALYLLPAISPKNSIFNLWQGPECSYLMLTFHKYFLCILVKGVSKSISTSTHGKVISNFNLKICLFGITFIDLFCWMYTYERREDVYTADTSNIWSSLWVILS